ncbi:hypothetical protein WALSEDRAFT_68507 [Wallemia mellicola CBS 633.66]|uniref:ferric-chelate reductase (NADPH) n=2 Tax=Wallemia mellicola TaxID=1708541 RepID=A0A4T0MNT6_9BASI|nr:hypothetical protein WALSEDRAFT_68507 [Wallemia mellicola CBS 633.66]TIB79202.1 hypothetical protein E3Q23_00360 [Wallemia mellicola]EIM22023.1 hypothetical protein WALSEDRAFT_68507 [Wallemia mellicola CBS 633.66]TIB84346.1 hypothetical protein E3Q21_02412 [Wallemia mellicola]TIB87488.1 hypothetical protein E3Q20_02459 [Wallemia mellicola]TIB98695.1 hypothetical protein E3Q18_01961 [Wallemia mellicola]|eukprot:XP_006957831.1 hypothetical protein WALSEDRAFT_68507 [Wallemia mellicola CBS 633.66]
MKRTLLTLLAYSALAKAQQHGEEHGGEHGGHHHSPQIFYGYLLIIIFGIIACGIALVTHTGLTHKSGIYNKFTRWSLHTPTFQYKLTKNSTHRRYLTLPSIAHMVGIFTLVIFPTMLVLTGPESPSTNRSTSDINQELHRNAFDRTGVIAFVLTPLLVILGLKVPPFAIFAFKWFTNLHFDKALFFHFITGFTVWAFSFAHTVLWIQHAWPRRDESGVWNQIWSSKMNSSGFMALLFLSLILLLSIPPIRTKFYALFHIVHICLVFAFLVAAGVHYKPLAPFIWVSLAFWLAERTWRGLIVLWRNAGAGKFHLADRKPNHWATVLRPAATIKSLVSPQMDKPANLTLMGWEELEKGRNNNTSMHGKSNTTLNKTTSGSNSNESTDKYVPPVVKHETPWMDPPSSSCSFPIRRSHPTGFVHAQLLPGKSVRLTLRLSTPMHWKPGQHASLIIPEISRFGAHPFTIANVDEDDPCKVVFIIRAKSGWTKRLWEKVRLMRQPKFISSEVNPQDSSNYLPCAAPPVYIRALIDGPYGSAERVKWSNYSSILLVCGGSGISFGVSILQHVCNTISLGSGPLRRVRLVWLVKEFAHVQWVASALRRCVTLLSSDAFQLEIFVTSEVKPGDYDPPTISSFFPSPRSPFPPTPATRTYSPPHSPVQRFYTPATGLGDDLVLSYSNLTMQTARASMTPATAAEPQPEQTEQTEQTAQLQPPPLAVTSTSSRIQPSFQSAQTQPEVDKSLPVQPSYEDSEFDTATSKQDDDNNDDDDDIEAINKRSSVNQFIEFDGEDDGPAPPVEKELSTLISVEGEAARAKSGMGLTSSNMQHAQTALSHLEKPKHTPNITFAETPKIQQDANHINGRTPHLTNTPLLKMPDPDNIVIDAIEEGDLFSIAEFARNGRPKLDHIFNQEADIADDNALLVATCGPEALNRTMKNLVSKSNKKTVAFEESFSW